MSGLEFAAAVRPGEHACSRLAHADDRERLAVGYVQRTLAHGNKVVYLADREDLGAFVDGLARRDDEIAAALQSDQLSVRRAVDVYAPDGVFDPERTLAFVAGEHAGALADGYPALSMSGEMSALDHLAGTEDHCAFEHCVRAHAGEGTLMLLCQYDPAGVAAGTLRDVADMHDVDVAPQLAAIGRDGYLAAASVGHGALATLRLCGVLDFGCADTVATMLGAHYHGRLRLDLQDLDFIDVAGMRALRGRTQQPLTILGASASVQRMLDLLAWDTDPTIEILAAP